MPPARPRISENHLPFAAPHRAIGKTSKRIAATVPGGVTARPPGRIGYTVRRPFGILPDGAVKTGVPSLSQTVIQGPVISTAMMVAQFQQCLQQGNALQRQAALGR